MNTGNATIAPVAFIPRYLGLVPYQEALALQQSLLQQRAANAIPDVLLLLQHPAVFTTGRFRGEGEMLASREQLEREGIKVVPTNRGGSITFHGPGQLVGYPICDLKELGIGVREYVWNLEDVVIRVLACRGIEGRRRAGYPGVWAGEDKICSLGIHVSRHITMHGLALNVNPDLRYFDYINPCGLRGVRMTSMSKVLGCPLTCEEIVPEVINAFATVFGLEAKPLAGKDAYGTPSEPCHCHSCEGRNPAPNPSFPRKQESRKTRRAVHEPPLRRSEPHPCHSERRRGIFPGWWPLHPKGPSPSLRTTENGKGDSSPNARRHGCLRYPLRAPSTSERPTLVAPSPISVIPAKAGIQAGAGNGGWIRPAQARRPAVPTSLSFLRRQESRHWEGGDHREAAGKDAYGASQPPPYSNEQS